VDKPLLFPNRLSTAKIKLRQAAFVLAMGALCLTPLSTSAKDVNIGGKAADGKDDSKKPKLNMVDLPEITAGRRTENGGVKHIQIEAWLAPKDIKELPILDERKTAICKRAKKAFEESHDISLDILASPREGETLAKKTILQATETELGHPWSGDVLMRTFLVY
jgi:hypothetical protein